MSANILDEIVQHKLTEIEQARLKLSEQELAKQIESAPPVRPFAAALEKANPPGLIAEVKRASPSAGLIRSDFNPVEIASSYAEHGAACLSVLTDNKYFQGHLDDLRAVRAAVAIPVMRKEFILDRYQILEARAAGADCVLLIAECLDHCRLRDLYFYTHELGMDALIEIYEPENLDRVLDLEPELLGINNRNLKTFVTDLNHTTELLDRIPDSVLVVSESGIRSHADVCRLRDSGVRGILVGESLMRQSDLAAAIQSLLNGDTRSD